MFSRIKYKLLFSICYNGRTSFGRSDLSLVLVYVLIRSSETAKKLLAAENNTILPLNAREDNMTYYHLHNNNNNNNNIEYGIIL